MAKSKKTLKYVGILVQSLACLANGILWCTALYAIGYAIVIGLSTGTISVEDPDILDWTISTPVTLFLFYGIPLLLVTTFGWFATVSGNLISLIIYVVLIACYTIFDVVFGISVMMDGDAYEDFLASLYKSIFAYGDDDPESVGVIPINATTYWDHLQRRGECCGLYSYEDWRNTTMARKSYAIPDSCCNEDYDYLGCGHLIWKHPDFERHTIESIVYSRGCLTIFPKAIQSDEDNNIYHLGIFLLIMLIIAIIFALILFVLVLSRAFRTPTGLNNPAFVDVPADPSLEIGRRDQVHPAPDSRGDRGNNADDDNDTPHKRISFDDSGPTMIPERSKTSRMQRGYGPTPSDSEGSPSRNGNSRQW